MNWERRNTKKEIRMTIPHASLGFFFFSFFDTIVFGSFYNFELVGPKYLFFYSLPFSLVRSSSIYIKLNDNE